MSLFNADSDRLKTGSLIKSPTVQKLFIRADKKSFFCRSLFRSSKPRQDFLSVIERFLSRLTAMQNSKAACSEGRLFIILSLSKGMIKSQKVPNADSRALQISTESPR